MQILGSAFVTKSLMQLFIGTVDEVLAYVTSSMAPVFASAL